MLQAINHATDHRRQSCGMLKELGIAPPRLGGWGVVKPLARLFKSRPEGRRRVVRRCSLLAVALLAGCSSVPEESAREFRVIYEGPQPTGTDPWADMFVEHGYQVSNDTAGELWVLCDGRSPLPRVEREAPTGWTLAKEARCVASWRWKSLAPGETLGFVVSRYVTDEGKFRVGVTTRSQVPQLRYLDTADLSSATRVWCDVPFLVGE